MWTLTEIRDQIEAQRRQASADMKAICAANGGANSFGITPDFVKALPSWRQAKARHDELFAKLRRINSMIVRA